MNKTLTLLMSIITLFSFSQMTSYNYNFDGLNREFNLFIPSNYDANAEPLPVVFFLHGLGGDMTNFSGLTYKAEQENYIMVVPQAISDQLAGTTWHSGAGNSLYYPNSGVDDVGFISSMIDSISTWYNVDQNKIYSTGFSMGGFMTNRLACELTDRFAAIASVSGTMGNEILNTCNPDNAIPMLHIHSTEDQVVSFDNNTFGSNAFPLIDFWINNNNCNLTADTVDMSNISNDGFTTFKYTYSGGDLNSEVILYQLGGPLHNQSWYTVQSGNDFDAVEVIWDFFEKHTKIDETENAPVPILITNIKEAKMDIFPNPASDIITLDFTNKIGLSSISIANTLGKRISNKTYEEPITAAAFDISKYAPGIYFFQIKDIEGNLSVLKFYKR